MIRLLASALLSLAAAPALAGASLDCATRAIWGARGITSDIAMDEGRVLVADGRGIAIYDAASPRLIREVAVATTERPAIALQRTGNRITALTVSSVEIFEERDGGLRRTGSAPATATTLGASATHVAAGGSDLTLFRIGAEGDLAVVARVPLDTPAVDVALDGALLYVAEREGGISIFEIGDGGLTRVGLVPIPAKSIEVVSGRLYAASGLYGVSIADVTDPRAPRIVATTTAGLTDARRIRRGGDLLWVDDAGARLVALHYDGARWTARAPLDGAFAAFAAVEHRLAAAPRAANGIESGVAFQLFETEPRLALAGEFRGERGPLAGVALRGDRAYVADPPLFRVLDLRDALGPREIHRIETGDDSDRVRLEGNLALVYGTGNVHMIDVAGSVPRRIGTFVSYGFPRSGAAMAGEVLLECNRATGFHVVDISDPASPRQISGLRNDGYGQFHGVVAMPRVAYALVTQGVKVVDLSNPRDARFVHFIPAPNVFDAEIAPANERRAALLLVLDAGLLRIFDLRHPLLPTEVSSIPIPPANDIAVDGDSAWLTTGDGALLAIDIADPARPQIRHAMSGLASPTQVAAEGGTIAIADRFALRILRDPALPLPREIALQIAASSSSRLGHLSWTAVRDAVYELQLAETSDFAAAQTIVTGRNELAFPLERATYARVRLRDGCTKSEWSNAVRLSPDDFSSIDFVGRGSHHVVGAGSERERIAIAVRNDSVEPRLAALAAEPGDGVALPPPMEIAPGARASIEIAVEPSPFASTREIALRLSGTNAAPYRLNVTTVRPSASDAPVAEGSLIVPAVGSTPGARGTMWRSDLHLFCGDTTCPTTIRFHRYGGGRSSREAALSLSRGETIAIGDAVARLFGATGEAGYLEIASPGALEAGATTYNDAPSGRFGERIPAIRARAASAPSRRLLLGIALDGRSRTNVGIIETSGRPASLTLTLHASDGAVVTAHTLSLAPHASLQQPLSVLFPSSGSLTGASIAVDGPADIVVYASRVDQRSGDSSFSYASQPASEPLVIDAAGLTPGAEGTFWRTSVQIANGSARSASVDLEFLPAGSAEAIARRIELPPNGSLATEDLVSDLFAAADPRLTAAGALRIRSDAPHGAWARVYNDHASGTFGQSLAPRPLGPPREDLIQLFPLSDDAERRTNVGFGEMSGRPARAALRFYDGSGALVAVASVTLAPHESATRLGILRALGLERLHPVRLEVEPEGNLSSWASVIERSTGDALFLTRER